jgi:hypothetical protein
VHLEVLCILLLVHNVRSALIIQPLFSVSCLFNYWMGMLNSAPVIVNWSGLCPGLAICNMDWKVCGRM